MKRPTVGGKKMTDKPSMIRRPLDLPEASTHTKFHPRRILMRSSIILSPIASVSSNKITEGFLTKNNLFKDNFF